MMDEKILLKHLENNQNLLIEYSKLINVAKHGTILGSARENVISSFLEQNLPTFIEYHSGEAFNNKGERSGQIDIILHPITSPKLFLNHKINLFPIETIMQQ